MPGRVCMVTLGSEYTRPGQHQDTKEPPSDSHLRTQSWSAQDKLVCAKTVAVVLECVVVESDEVELLQTELTLTLRELLRSHQVASSSPETGCPDSLALGRRRLLAVLESAVDLAVGAVALLLLLALLPGHESADIRLVGHLAADARNYFDFGHAHPLCG